MCARIPLTELTALLSEIYYNDKLTSLKYSRSGFEFDAMKPTLRTDDIKGRHFDVVFPPEPHASAWWGIKIRKTTT